MQAHDVYWELSCGFWSLDENGSTTQQREPAVHRHRQRGKVQQPNSVDYVQILIRTPRAVQVVTKIMQQVNWERAIPSKLTTICSCTRSGFDCTTTSLLQMCKASRTLPARRERREPFATYAASNALDDWIPPALDMHRDRLSNPHKSRLLNPMVPLDRVLPSLFMASARFCTRRVPGPQL